MSNQLVIMIFRIATILSIVLSCSDSSFDSNISPVPAVTATATADAKEKAEVTSGLLPVNESGSVVASNIWESQGKELEDLSATIEGSKNTTDRSMLYKIDKGNTSTTQHNRVQESSHTWLDREETETTSQDYTQSTTIFQRPLDVLLVIDISGSMSDERRGLGTRLNKLLAHIEDSDWRLAITTTDAGQCLLKEWIISKRQGVFDRGVNEFKKIVSGEDDSGDSGEISQMISDDGRNYERPILMAINGLGGDKMVAGSTTSWCRGLRSVSPLPKKLNNDWLAKESMIAVILVTDEDNSELAEGHGGLQQDLDTSELTNYLQNTLGKTKGISYEIYGLLNPSAQDSYRNIIDDENIQNVMSPNYDNVLTNVSTSIMETLNKTLDISNIAGKDGFRFIGIKGKTKGTEYTINGNIITFNDNHVPAKDARIVVNYSYTKLSTIKNKGLNYTPLDNTLKVTKVSGCGSWQDNHSVGTCNNNTIACVKHQTRPPDGCKLKYTYKMRDLRLKSAITLVRPNNECQIVENTINLMVGSSTRRYSYNSSKQQLSFTPQQTDDGKNIVATYKCKKKILSYLYTGGTNNDKITCKKDDVTINCTHRNGKITILEKDFVNGAKFTIERPLPPDNQKFELEDGYVANSLTLVVTDNDGQQTTCDSSKLVVNNDEVLLDTTEAKQKCSALDNMHKVILTYKRQQEHLFELGNDFFNANPHKDERWQVAINGTPLEADAYELDKEARTIKLKSAPTPEAKIEIMVELLW